jgi:hypothetical protein
MSERTRQRINAAEFVNDLSGLSVHAKSLYAQNVHTSTQKTYAIRNNNSANVENAHIACGGTIKADQGAEWSLDG